MDHNQKSSTNVLEKAISESYSKDSAEKFDRIEKRYNDVNKAKLRSQLDRFRAEAVSMTFMSMMLEKHSSTLLGNFLRATHMPRPGARWEAHHIVSGGHRDAEEARTVLASDDIKIRIDDPDNGCWMPKTKADARPTIYPNAIGHNRIHRQRYYRWIFNTILPMTNAGMVRAFLLTVRAQLLQGNIKDELLLQEEIDDIEYEQWLKSQR